MLEPTDEAVVIAVIERWSHEANSEQIPDGVFALLATLHGDAGLD